LIRQFITSLGKHVIYFAGYGELGYEEKDTVRCVALEVLSQCATHDVLVHSGTLLRLGGHDGIAEVYRVARELGIETSGVYPSVSMEFSDTHRVSPDCDHVFFVEDKTWGGCLNDSGELSPTLDLHLKVSDELIVIGGGKHAADELRAFFDCGKSVRYFPADMNHATTRQWARHAGLTITDFQGAARSVWKVICGSKHQASNQDR
jgi:hypothetical protein